MTITISVALAVEQDLNACEVSPITEYEQAISIAVSTVSVVLTGHWGLKIN